MQPIKSVSGLVGLGLAADVVNFGSPCDRCEHHNCNMPQRNCMTESTLDLTKLYEAILIGDASAAKEIVEAAIAAAVDPQLLVTGQMIPAMDEVGRRFEAGESGLPELISRASHEGLALLQPLLAARGVEPIGRVVIGVQR